MNTTELREKDQHMEKIQGIFFNCTYCWEEISLGRLQNMPDASLCYRLTIWCLGVCTEVAIPQIPANRQLWDRVMLWGLKIRPPPKRSSKTPELTTPSSSLPDMGTHI